MGSDQAPGIRATRGDETTRSAGISHGAGTTPGAGTGRPAEDRPGDPACLLRRVCPACGAVADHDPPTVCPQCQADMPAG
jgi:hypothetical protein